MTTNPRKVRKKVAPVGFTCECGTFHKFGLYVAAHSHENLTHTCISCEAKHSIYRGRVMLIKSGKPAGTALEKK